MAQKTKKPSKGGGPAHGPRGPKPKNTKATFTRLLGYLGKSKMMLVFVFIFLSFFYYRKFMNMLIYVEKKSFAS